MTTANLSIRRRRMQAGLTLIEFMISIVLGMIVVAAIAVLIANQSATRGEVDRAGRLIENGRYSVQMMADDLQMAGYWGDLTTIPAGVVPTAMPNPCSTTVTSGNAASPGIQEATYLPVQGYDSSTYSAGTWACLSNWKTGTDILVVRRLDVSQTAIASLTDGQVYMQTGLLSATGSSFTYKIYAGNSASNATNFPLVNKAGTVTSPRAMLVHIYYVATCDVCSGGGADTIPTLKRVELGVSSSAPSMTCSTCTATIAEGVENLQLDYGRDTDADGTPDGSDTNGSAFGIADWNNVVSVKIYLLARSIDTSPGFTDTKTYAMGSFGTFTPTATAYQRHLFIQSVRLANPSLRRSS